MEPPCRYYLCKSRKSDVFICRHADGDRCPLFCPASTSPRREITNEFIMQRWRWIYLSPGATRLRIDNRKHAFNINIFYTAASKILMAFLSVIDELYITCEKNAQFEILMNFAMSRCIIYLHWMTDICIHLDNQIFVQLSFGTLNVI